MARARDPIPGHVYLLRYRRMEHTEIQIDDPGEMHIRREVMQDGKRYIIFYTFGDETTETADEVSEDV